MAPDSPIRDLMASPIVREVLGLKRAASAAAFVLQDSRKDFSSVSKAWTGLV